MKKLIFLSLLLAGCGQGPSDLNGNYWPKGCGFYQYSLKCMQQWTYNKQYDIKMESK